MVTKKQKIWYGKIKNQLKIKCSPQYIPDEIISIREVPYTLSGKKLEIPIKKILLGSDPSEVIKYDSLKNPNSLEFFIKYRQLVPNWNKLVILLLIWN